MKNIAASALLLLGTYIVTHAQVAVGVTALNNADALVTTFSRGLVATTGYLLMGVAVVVFFIGIVQFIWATKSGEASAIEKGRRFMLWGIIALFTMVSLWGLVSFIQRTLGISGNSAIILPSMNFSDGSGTGNNSSYITNQNGVTVDPLTGNPVTSGGMYTTMQAACKDKNAGDECSFAGDVGKCFLATDTSTPGLYCRSNSLTNGGGSDMAP